MILKVKGEAVFPTWTVGAISFLYRKSENLRRGLKFCSNGPGGRPRDHELPGRRLISLFRQCLVKQAPIARGFQANEKCPSECEALVKIRTAISDVMYVEGFCKAGDRGYSGAGPADHVEEDDWRRTAACTSSAVPTSSTSTTTSGPASSSSSCATGMAPRK